MASEASGPGILYVNSKITDPSKLSPELFTKWYQDVHIPDIFVTSGIKSAYRYFTSSPNPESVDRPYLALYPLKEVGFLQTAEFGAIPVTSDILPGKEIFDTADFDTRYYTMVGQPSTDGQHPGSPYLITVQFDAPQQLKSASDDEVKSWYADQLSSVPSKGFKMFKNYFSRQNRNAPENNEIGTPPKYLALHEIADKDDMQGLQAAVKSAGIVSQFGLLKAFIA